MLENSVTRALPLKSRLAVIATTLAALCAAPGAVAGPAIAGSATATTGTGLIPAAAAATAPLAVQGLGVGQNFSCALAAGKVQCWGANALGQLGDGTRVDRTSPVTVLDLGPGVRAISAGTNHACAITASSALKCWGANAGGQTGQPAAPAQLRAQGVLGLSGPVTSVSAGPDYTCAITTGVHCWGRNTGGQLGTGTNSVRPAPVRGLAGAALRVRTYRGFACARLVNLSVACWGDNRQGFLGDGTKIPHTSPVQVSAIPGGATTLAAGVAYHSCLTDTRGAVRCWGTDTFGEAGNGELPRSGVLATPVAVRGLPGPATRVVVGEYHSCAQAASKAYCWGNNDWGQLGDNTVTDRYTAVPVSGLSGPVVSLAAGTNHSCAVTQDGGIWCWGHNGNGQLGDRTFQPHARAMPVLGFLA